MSTVYTFQSWPFGEVVCKLGEFTVSLSLGVSVFTLTALSAERYMVIVHPMSAVHRSTAGVSSSLIRTVLVAAGIWALAAGLASVELVAARVSPAPVVVCHAYPEDWGDAYVSFHVIFRFIVYFAMPITTIAVFYALMARMLIVSAKQMPGEGGNGHAVKQVRAVFYFARNLKQLKTIKNKYMIRNIQFVILDKHIQSKCAFVAYIKITYLLT